jgi:hypothetical protein
MGNTDSDTASHQDQYFKGYTSSYQWTGQPINPASISSPYVSVNQNTLAVTGKPPKDPGVLKAMLRGAADPIGALTNPQGIPGQESIEDYDPFKPKGGGGGDGGQMELSPDYFQYAVFAAGGLLAAEVFK